jgi:quinol monooxygenase YgiN
MRVVRIAELDIDPAQLTEYKALLTEEIDASVSTEPGVLFLHAVAEKDNPARLHIFECYASQEAYDAHLTTPHFLKYKTMTAGMVKSLALIPVDPIRLAAKGD